MKDEKIKKKFAVRKEGKLKAIYLIWHGWELIEAKNFLLCEEAK
jgi:hypothetical protein